MNTNKRKIPASVKELLKNSSFILWCYNPTDEADAWWANWQQEHPEREKDVTEARIILLKAQFNQTPFPSEDSRRLFSRIETSAIRRRKQRKQRSIFYSVAAACVACLFVSGIWLYFQNDSNIEMFPVLADFAQIDSLQTEIELELINQEKLLVNNKTAIKLNEEGTLQIEDRKIAVATDKSDPQDTLQVTTNTKMNVLKVPRGRHTVVHLSDGSRVWVNSETVLQFPAVFDKKHRTIYADGEIYLEVAKDESRPFHVKTSQMDVRVLGTSFNVTAYKDDTNQSVVLREGSVEINTSDGQKRNIQPNDRLVLEDNRMSVAQVNSYYYTSWIDGVLFFDGQDLKHIAQRLSRYYRIDFVCAPEIENYKGSGKLVLFNDTDKVLHTLKEAFPILGEMKGDTIQLRSSY